MDMSKDQASVAKLLPLLLLLWHWHALQLRDTASGISPIAAKQRNQHDKDRRGRARPMLLLAFLDTVRILAPFLDTVRILAPFLMMGAVVALLHCSSLSPMETAAQAPVLRSQCWCLELDLVTGFDPMYRNSLSVARVCFEHCASCKLA
jgi:hypothetical protein